MKLTGVAIAPALTTIYRLFIALVLTGIVTCEDTKGGYSPFAPIKTGGLLQQWNEARTEKMAKLNDKVKGASEKITEVVEQVTMPVAEFLRQKEAVLEAERLETVLEREKFQVNSCASNQHETLI